MSTTATSTKFEKDVFDSRIAEALGTEFRVVDVVPAYIDEVPSGYTATLVRDGVAVAALVSPSYGESAEVIAADGYDAGQVLADLVGAAFSVRPASHFVPGIERRIATDLLIADLVQHADVVKKMNAKRGLVFRLAGDGDFWSTRTYRFAPRAGADRVRAQLAATPGARVWDSKVGDFVAAGTQAAQ